jgi:hypothetical protein
MPNAVASCWKVKPRETSSSTFYKSNFIKGRLGCLVLKGSMTHKAHAPAAETVIIISAPIYIIKGVSDYSF